MNMSRIIIFGASGMLGRQLQKVFEDKGTLFLYDKDLDITNFTETEKVCNSIRPTVIINAAANTDVDGCEKDFNGAMHVNGYAPGFLAKIAKQHNAVLVHYSTDYIFKGTNEHGYTEDNHNINPVNAYGTSKAVAEDLIKLNCSTYYIIRTSWMFGGQGANFVDTMLRLGKEKDKLRVIDDQFGKPTYAPDLACATLQLLKESPPYGIYHRTNETEGVGITWHAFASEIFAKTNNSIPVEPITTKEYPLPATRPKYSALVNTKLPKMRLWTEALEDYLSMK